MAVEPTTKYQKEIKRLIFDVDWSTNPTLIIEIIKKPEQQIFLVGDDGKKSRASFINYS